MPAGLGLDQAAARSSCGVAWLRPCSCSWFAGPVPRLRRSTRGRARRPLVSGARAGSAGGQVLCVSTLGSLAGTFGTTHLLLPSLGRCHVDVDGGGSGAGPRGRIHARHRWGRSAQTALSLLAAGDAGCGGRPPARPGRSSPIGMRLLERVESPVPEPARRRSTRAELLDRELRLLQVNEGLDSFQSVWVPETGLDRRGLLLRLLLRCRRGGPARGPETPGACASSAWGPGTTFRVIEGASPAACGAGPDRCGARRRKAVELGRRWFDLRHARARSDGPVRMRDARTLPCAVDVAGNRPGRCSTPTPTRSRSRPICRPWSSCREVRNKLAPGGWLAINVGGFGFDGSRGLRPGLHRGGGLRAGPCPGAARTQVHATSSCSPAGTSAPLAVPDRQGFELDRLRRAHCSGRPSLPEWVALGGAVRRTAVS